MRLANFTDYSLRVLIYLGLKENALATVAEIATKYQISQNHLVKVVHNLSKMGLIKSFKGKGGGLALAISPEHINIGSLIQQLEAETPLVECLGSKSTCRIDPGCTLKSALKKAEQNFYLTLNEFSLADILNNPNYLKAQLEL